MFKRVCEECGKDAIGMISLATGRVRIDGKDVGQDVDLCADHWVGPCVIGQPKNCKKVTFYWPEGKKEG